MGGPPVPTRVVSLVPSATETLVTWGATPVGVTRFCEQPSLLAVGGTKDPDLDVVARLAPDLVVMCEEENRREDAEALDALGIRVHALRIDSLADVGEQLRRLAGVLELEPDPAALGDIDTAGGSTSQLRTAEGKPIRAFVPIWRRPWMTISARTYGASLLASLGVDVVVSDSPDRYPQVTLDEVRDHGAQVVLAPSEPYPFAERHRSELEAVAPVSFVDGQDLFWWGVRTPVARRRLADALVDLPGIIDMQRPHR